MSEINDKKTENDTLSFYTIIYIYNDFLIYLKIEKNNIKLKII